MCFLLSESPIRFWKSQVADKDFRRRFSLAAFDLKVSQSIRSRIFKAIGRL